MAKRIEDLDGGGGDAYAISILDSCVHRGISSTLTYAIKSPTRPPHQLPSADTMTETM